MRVTTGRCEACESIGKQKASRQQAAIANKRKNVYTPTMSYSSIGSGRDHTSAVAAARPHRCQQNEPTKQKILFTFTRLRGFSRSTF